MVTTTIPNKSIKLKVMESLQEDAYKGIARINTATMRQLGLKPGDVISIKGGRDTVAIIDRAYPADLGEQIIRIDGILRKNAKTGIGEIVGIDKADIQEAKKITIAPSQKGVSVRADPEHLKRGLLGRACATGDLVALGGTQRRKDLMADSSFEELFGGIFGDAFPGMNMGISNIQQIKFIIVNTNPKQPVIITENTEVTLNSVAVEVQEENIPDVNYEDIGGLDEPIRRIREMVELPLKHPELFVRLGIEPPKGVLLYGSPGCGKTLLAKAVANESEAHFLLLNGPEIMSKFYGESEKKIRDLFDDAEKNAPSIVFIDEIDSVAPKRDESYGEVERRVVSQILTCMDGLKNRGKVVVIGATNRPDALDPALRRPGRFDREIDIGVPDKKGRLDVLKIHTRTMPLAKDVNLGEYASFTHGFVGADLSSLCKEAAMARLRKLLPSLNLKGKGQEEEPFPQEILDKLTINDKDFRDALKVVQPSAMREVYVESPNVKWNDVGGLENIKQELKEAVEWPLLHPDAFKRVGIRPPRGILIYGPPGTGKTMLAKAVATESQANFIQVKGPELLSKWVGESEKGVRKVFERARQVAPCIVFFDEIDALASRRGYEQGTKVGERVLNQMLAEMDGIEQLEGVVIIGATNRPDMLDPALIRPGRFDRIVSTPIPTKESRLEIFKIHTKSMPIAKDVNIELLAEKSEGYVGSDIEGVCREAGMLALRDDINVKEVKKKNFEEAMKKVRASVSLDDAKQYKEIEQMYIRKARAAIEKPDYFG
jgi:transitional endoplasmic reticulum ATPase